MATSQSTSTVHFLARWRKVQNDPDPNKASSKKSLKFWLVVVSMCICLFFPTLQLFSVPTALPAIATALDSSQLAWIVSAYALSSTAFLPISGGLAQTFGRQRTLLAIIGLFALGSSICGGATSMEMLIAGRVVQGLGGGGIQSLTGIILADLVTLEGRGVYTGLFALTRCLAISIGPIVGGSIAEHGQWRWIFYLNLPIACIAGALVVALLDLPVPPGTYREKISQMDWIGSFLIVSSTTASTIGFTFAGLTAPWGSATVLVPLILGLVGLCIFIIYEATFAKRPLVPFSLLTNRTSVSGYVQTFCSTAINFAVTYFFPIYLQGCKDASLMTSGLEMLGFASLGPASVIIGLSVKATGWYRPQMWVGWTLSTIALCFMSTLRATDTLAKPIGYLVLLGFSAGVPHVTLMCPIQAPVPVAQNARAIAFTWFLHSFSAVWSATIGITVLQNELQKRLSASFVASVPRGTAIMYALIPEMRALPLDARSDVQAAFASSLAVLWRVLAAISAAGLLASLFMKGLPLHNELDEDWASKSKEGHCSTLKDGTA